MSSRPLLCPSLSVRRYGASRGSHAHDHFQVLVGLEGTLELEVEGRGLRLGGGDGWVVAPGDRHDFEAGAAGSRCLVLDTPSTLWTPCAGRRPETPQALALAGYLAQCLSPDAAAAGEPAPLALQHGPALLLEAWGAPPALDPRRRRIDWTALAAWARQRWEQPPSVAALAEVACLSPSQFAQRCREEQGLGPMAWLRAQRLAHARTLRRAGIGVAETARRTGYRSPSALTAALRRAGAPG